MTPQARAAQGLQQRMDAGTSMNQSLSDRLDGTIPGGTDDQTKNTATRKAGLNDVDWRVPRLQYCLDPKYNNLPMNPMLQQQLAQRRMFDAQNLEAELADEAQRDFDEKIRERMPDHKGAYPTAPEESDANKKVNFMEVEPNYRREDDIWERKLALRMLDEAMKGDVSMPMPRPVLFAEDYENYRVGKYVKDDCPIA